MKQLQIDGYELSEDNGVDIWLTFGQVREMLKRIVSE